MADKNLTNIQIYQRKTKYNIGVILFGIIFIYLVITILAYVTNKKVSIYEVREGSILKDNAYTGLVLRDEQIVKADSDGYVNYFVTEGSKVGSKTNVYSISQNKLGLDDQDASTGTEDDSCVLWNLQPKSRHPSYKKHILLQRAFVPSNIMMSTILKIQLLTSC